VIQPKTGEFMAQESATHDVIVNAQLHSEIQLFYARQMQLLDAGDFDNWALTFAVDGVFAANAYPTPVAGRDNIAAAAQKATVALAEQGLQRRHWLGMLSVESDGGVVRVTCYALVIETPRAGVPSLRHSTVCTDELHRSGGEWVVRKRYVQRDDLK
jgi:hypothetical protein